MHPARAIAGMVMVAATSLGAACGGPGTLDAHALEVRLKRTLERDGVPMESMTCPKGQPRRKGDVFTCEGKARTGAVVLEQVQQKNASGSVEYAAVGGVLEVAKIRDRLKEEAEAAAHVTVDVRCDAAGPVAADGQTFNCDLINAGDPTDTIRFAITVDTHTPSGFARKSVER